MPGTTLNAILLFHTFIKTRVVTVRNFSTYDNADNTVITVVVGGGGGGV